MSFSFTSSKHSSSIIIIFWLFVAKKILGQFEFFFIYLVRVKMSLKFFFGPLCDINRYWIPVLLLGSSSFTSSLKVSEKSSLLFGLLWADCKSTRLARLKFLCNLFDHLFIFKVNILCIKAVWFLWWTELKSCEWSWSVWVDTLNFVSEASSSTGVTAGTAISGSHRSFFFGVFRDRSTKHLPCIICAGSTGWII